MADVDATPDDVVARVREELKRAKREDEAAETQIRIEATLGRIEADMEEVAGFLRTLRWWGPILIAALLGDDAITELIRARVNAPISEHVPVEHERTGMPVAALPKDP